MWRSVRRWCVCGTVLAGVAVPAAGALAGSAVNTGYFGGVAIMGYDPVAYFTEGRPVKGSPEFAYRWLGTPWHFANARHRDMFIQNPERYAPQYGGYCVGEVAADGVTVSIDPNAWRIVDGKLYLSYDQGFADEFAANPEEYLSKAESNWPQVKAELEQEPYR